MVGHVLDTWAPDLMAVCVVALVALRFLRRLGAR